MLNHLNGAAPGGAAHGAIEHGPAPGGQCQWRSNGAAPGGAAHGAIAAAAGIAASGPGPPGEGGLCPCRLAPGPSC